MKYSKVGKHRCWGSMLWMIRKASLLKGRDGKGTERKANDFLEK